MISIKNFKKCKLVHIYNFLTVQTYWIVSEWMVSGAGHTLFLPCGSQAFFLLKFPHKQLLPTDDPHSPQTNMRNYSTEPVRTIFLFKCIWTRSQGSQGCHNIRFYFSKMKVLSFCAKIAPERHKLWKTIKIGKKCQKTPVFINFFEYSSIWRQY